MRDGYAFELQTEEDWRTAHNDSWETVVYTATGGEDWIGSRSIDGSVCKVFACPDGKFRAQTAAFLNGGV
jgi:hypothetical protein